ncbi:MAG: hypothetical protein V4719_21445 [Planctomycetota bacterium]
MSSLRSNECWAKKAAWVPKIGEEGLGLVAFKEAKELGHQNNALVVLLLHTVAG